MNQQEALDQIRMTGSVQALERCSVVEMLRCA
jgi:hypothetical protein